MTRAGPCHDAHWWGMRRASPDASPPRRRPRHDSPDASPPRRPAQPVDSDASPPRRRPRQDSLDASPPRRPAAAQADGDASPPRRRPWHDSPDASLPRRPAAAQAIDRDASLPRRRPRHDLPDASPPRRRAGRESPDALPERTQRWCLLSSSACLLDDVRVGAVMSIEFHSCLCMSVRLGYSFPVPLRPKCQVQADLESTGQMVLYVCGCAQEITTA
jgi:hypothetical protein